MKKLSSTSGLNMGAIRIRSVAAACCAGAAMGTRRARNPAAEAVRRLLKDAKSKPRVAGFIGDVAGPEGQIV